MRNLHDAITAALMTPHTPLWLPDVTDALVEIGWHTLYRRTGITRDTYGTARVYAGDTGAPRHVVACLPFRAGVAGEALHLLIECLTENCARRYQSVGLIFYTSDTLPNTTVFHCLQEAIGILTSLPTLHRTIAQLVRVCHLVRPEDDDYDVSYSDPHVPFSICVSVPLERQVNDVLRVVEALVHEAMHLQLTLIELVTPLVQPSDERYFSPWKGTYRAPQSVLHALYVFRVIDQCFEQLLALPEWSSGSIDYIHRRRGDIASQVREIEVFKNSHALTALGARFVQKLMDD